MAQLLLPRLREPSVIPGFGLALGFTIAALSLIVLIPLSVLVLHAASIGPTGFWTIAADPRTLAALGCRSVQLSSQPPSTRSSAYC